jgi:ATP-dependent Clp protease ATP-binding subunit ClpA
MAFELTIPFYAFRLHLKTGGSLIAPLNDREVVRIRERLPVLAGQYAEALQRKVLNQGQISELLDEYQRGSFIPARIKVSFPGAKDRFSFPAFDLEFSYFFNQLEAGGGIWAIVPALNLEVFASVPEELEKQIGEAIHLDFVRHRRLQAVQHIVSAIWYDLVELKQHPITLHIPSPRELEELESEPEDSLLPKAATELKVNKPVSYGRAKELRQLAQILNSDFHRNTILVGPSGTGKTALVWEFARRRESFGVKARIWETTAATLIKELMKDTGWQENLSLLCRELSGQPSFLFVRNLMDLFEVGKYEGNSMSIADYLLPYLTRGEVTLISECTDEELARIEIKHPTYLSVFQRINLSEPEPETLKNIIERKATDLAKGQRVSIDPDAIQETVRLSRRFTPYDGMPGRPIRFLENLLLNLRGKSLPGTEKRQIAIRRSEIMAQFSEETGMPQFMIDPDLPMNPQELLTHFNNLVFGQEKAVEQIVGILSAVKTALSRTGKPIASLLFVGPTGVGKTELAKQLASFMFGTPDRMTRFDMSEFSTPYAVQRLIGQSYFSEGLLTSAIRKAPFGVLLFDEMEKAHPVFFDLLLQMLSEGRLTDSQGRLVNFCSTIIIMTSNVGASSLQLNPIGWQKDQSVQSVEDHFLNAVQKYFRPELFNRIDQVVPFAPLDQLTIRYVLDREIEQLRQREGIRFRRMSFTLTEPFLEHLATKGYDKQYGARHLQRTLRHELILPLARALNQEDIDDQVEILVDLKDGQPHLTSKTDPMGLDLLLEEYTKITYADHAGSLRRSVEKLMEGSSYIRMLSELDLLTAARQRKGKSFWDEKENGHRYGVLSDQKASFEALLQHTEQLELQLSLASLGLQVYLPKWEDALDEVEQLLQQEKLNLYATLHPDSNECLLYLIGAAPEPLIHFYEALTQDLAFEITSTAALWLREEGSGAKIITTPHEWSGDQPKPKAAYDKLAGACLRIKGQAANVFFQPEDGVHVWEEEQEVTREFYIFSTPGHKPAESLPGAALQKRLPAARRIVTGNTIRDTQYDLNREYHSDQLMELIREQLDLQFQVNIDTIIG